MAIDEEHTLITFATADDITRLTDLNTQVADLLNADIQRSVQVAQEASTLVDDLLAAGVDVPLDLIAVAWMQWAQGQVEMGEYGAALLNARRSLPLFRTAEQVAQQADVLKIIGRCYSSMGDYSEALSHFTQAMELAHQLKDKTRISGLLISISTVHYYAGDYAQTLATELEVLRLVRETADIRGQATIFNNLALTYMRLKQYDAAMEHAQEALRLVLQLPETGLRADVLDTMGAVFMERQEFAKALDYFQQAVLIAERGGYRQALAESLSNSGRAYLAMGQGGLALQVVKSALELAELLDTKLAISEYYDLLARIYKEQGVFELSLAHYEQAQALKQELFSHELANRMANLQVIYRTETAQREAEIYQLKTVELERMVAERTQEVSAALEREHQLAQELRWALQRETELSKLKSRVISAVSHEFRTPLTVIATSAALLEKYPDKLGPERQGKQFEKIRDAIRYLDELLRDVLLIDTANEAVIEMRPQPLSLHQLTTLLKEDFGSLSPQIVVEPRADLQVVHVDYGRVKQVLSAFVSNALKYSEPETAVRLRVTPHADTVQITVTDAGIGVPVAEQALLFEPFVRASNVQAQRGLGLGLHIARRLALAMGGRVWCRSEGVGMGSEFGLELPKGGVGG